MMLMVRVMMKMMIMSRMPVYNCKELNTAMIVGATKKTNHLKNFISDVVDLQNRRWAFAELGVQHWPAILSSILTFRLMSFSLDNGHWTFPYKTFHLQDSLQTKWRKTVETWTWRRRWWGRACEHRRDVPPRGTGDERIDDNFYRVFRSFCQLYLNITQLWIVHKFWIDPDKITMKVIWATFAGATKDLVLTNVCKSLNKKPWSALEVGRLLGEDNLINGVHAWGFCRNQWCYMTCFWQCHHMVTYGDEKGDGVLTVASR